MGISSNSNVEHALQSLLSSVDYQPVHANAITVSRSPTGLASTMPLADAASAVMAAQAAALIDISAHRTGQVQAATIDRYASSVAMAANNYLRVDGNTLNTWDPLTGYYQTADDQWVYCHTNFDHLRDGLLTVLGIDNDQDAMANAIARWNADPLEDTCVAQGVCVTRLRTRTQWETHPQYQSLQHQPVIRLTRIGDATPTPFDPVNNSRPLSGLRVLDLSRVIAGPMAGRTLAEHGATVMLVSSPNLPSIGPLVIDTGPGKHSTFLDLNKPADSEALNRLTDQADIFLDAYRPGALASYGLSPQALAKRRPGIIYLSLSAYSDQGPWAGRRGFDTLVQATTGLAQDHGGKSPQRLPCQPLDYMTGYLAAYGAMVASLKRAEQGGSWHVEMSLARTANWLWDISDHLSWESTPPTSNPELNDVKSISYTRDTPFGQVSALAPVIKLSETPGSFVQPPVPLGTHSPQWPS